LGDWDSSYEGCECDANSTCLENCKCSDSRKFKCVDNKMYLDQDCLSKGPQNQTTFLRECHLGCKCNESSCMNRTVQNGCAFNLEIFELANKGRCVRTLEQIGAGAFVIDYLGELIGLNEAVVRFEHRQALNESNYILVLREYFSGGSNQATITTCIDARDYGNMARFINHSCEPNLIVLPWRIDNVIPHAVLFAIRDINPMEELSYDYNGLAQLVSTSCAIVSSKQLCYCNSKTCRIYLPGNEF
jgi:histone-lysine N-methyltransferase SETMAR